jgi:1-acyl-sn-glycerol-3-phosphate acyltransferase
MSGKATRTYAVVRGIARTLLWSQYRRIEVEGAERVPADGPVLLVANHFSAIADSMALLHACPRPTSFLAKAPLFHSALLRPFLEATGAVPVFRPQDAAENEGRGARANLETFRACRERLEQGACLAIFPEGVSQPQPRLMPLRTGAARILTDTEAPVSVVPAGLVWDHPTVARRGTLLVRFGAPFLVRGMEGHASRRAAIEGVTRAIEAAIRHLLAEASSQGELAALRALRAAWDQETGAPPVATLAERHARDRAFAHALADLRERAPAEVDALRAETDAYLRALDLAGVPAESVEVRYDARAVLRFLVGEGLPFLLLEPLALVAALATWPVRRGGDVLALRAFGGGEDVRALCRMLGIGFLLVVATAGGAATAGALAGWRAALAVLAGLPLLLAFHVAWRERRLAILARARAFLLLAGSPLRSALRRQRHGLLERVRSLAARRAPA